MAGVEITPGKIDLGYLTNQNISKPPCAYLKPHDYLIPKSIRGQAPDSEGGDRF